MIKLTEKLTALYLQTLPTSLRPFATDLLSCTIFNFDHFSNLDNIVLTIWLMKRVRGTVLNSGTEVGTGSSGKKGIKPDAPLKSDHVIVFCLFSCYFLL